MLKPNAVLSRILSLLLLPPAAAAFSSAQLVKGSVAPMAAVAAPAPFADDAEKEDHPDHSGDRDKNSNTLTIESPTHGQLITTTTTAKVVLKVGSKLDRKTLQVRLNGKNVTSLFARGRHDDEEDGTLSATLTTSNGLRKGVNLLRAGILGRDKHVEVRRVKFDYYYGLGAGQNQPNYLPSTVGLSLKPGGVQPWVTLTTGTPASLQDNSDTTQYSLAYPDTTFPTAKDTPCTMRYQVVVLNRFNPAQEDGYMCAPDAGTLKSDLAGLTVGTEIVLVGTTVNNTADAGLDTTSIGGTNYSSPNVWEPMEYAAIGVSGAAPGSAYESYYISPDLGTAYWTSPFANGFLAVDVNGNYNFHAGDNLQFEVSPLPSDGSAFVAISYNGFVHDWVPPSGSNGFWLLTLDRVTLLPIDATNDSSSPCQAWAPAGAQTCGKFYETGSTDPSTAAAAVFNLAIDLHDRDDRQLAVLTALGQPFQSGTSGGLLVTVANEMGGAGYLLPQLTTPTSTYTLITPGVVHPGVSDPPLTPFSRGVVNSSSAFSQQGQTGFVRGVMARDNNGLYYPAVVSQEDGKGNAQGATTVSIDYDFYSISSQTPGDWPLTDTSGHIAAYHWASQQFLQYEKITETGSHVADLRYFYGSNYTAQIISHATDFNCSVNPNVPNCVYSGENNGFTASDLADANAQLYTEIGALNDTYNYLDAPGIGGVIKGNSGVPSVSGQVIDASYQVLDGQVGAIQSTSVSASSFDWMNLFAGITSVAAAALGPADLPIAAAMTGVVSGALWSGSALDPWWQGGNTNTPPSYENVFDTTLGNLSNNSGQYAISLTASYGAALDNIYSDWGKLSATGVKTADSNSGWQFNNELSSLLLGENLAAGVRRSMYLQLLPQFYSQDTYTQQPVSNIDTLGMFYTAPTRNDQWSNSCTASYPSSISGWGWAHYANPSSAGTTDIYAMGGVINNQGTKNVTESLPADTLLNTLFTAPSDGDQSVTGPLNIPYDLVFGTSLLPTRTGPKQNAGTAPWCYKPGCSDVTNIPTNSSCIAP